MADLLVRCLENEGVTCVFGIPGEENIRVTDALFRSSIRYVLVRHEQGAAHMADGYARASGKVGVLLSHLGPGLTNAATGWEVTESAARARTPACSSNTRAPPDSALAARRRWASGASASRKTLSIWA